MARAGSSLTADAIRIEDEVWDDAFQTRVPSRRRRIIDRDVTHRDVARQDVIRQDVARRDSTADSSWMSDSSLAVELSDWLAPSASPTAADFAPPATTTTTPVAAPVAQTSQLVASPARRTVKIQGRGAERNLPWSGQTTRRRPSRAMHERAGLRPDRLAMWAVFLGLLLVLVAAMSGHG